MKDKIVNLKGKFFTAGPNRLEWGVALSAFFLIFTTMFYSDNFGMFLTYFWENEELFTGKSIDFFGTMQLPYGLAHQWLCQIWVLPINLFYHLFEFDFNSPMAVLWYKLCIPVFLVICMREMRCIADTLGIEAKRIKWMLFLFVTTVLVALPVFHVAQTDALYLLFMLKGFHALLKKDTKKFLLWFAISVSFKVISLFIFIPLILLEEKRILYVLRNLILGCVIVPIQQVWYRIIAALNSVLFPVDQSADPMAAVVETAAAAETAGTVETQAGVVEGFYSHFFNKSLYFEFPAVRKGYVASLLIFLFVLLCIWCYMQKKEETEKWQQKCLYAAAISLALFFVMASPSPYWIVILYPFLFLLIYTNHDRLRFNLILEKAFTMTMFLVYVMNTYWVYGGAQSFDWLFLTKWGIVPFGHEFQGGPNIAGYLEKISVDKFMPIITAVCLASIIGIAWINYPKVKCDEELTEEYKIELQHGMAIFNTLFLLVWYVVNVILISRY